MILVISVTPSAMTVALATPPGAIRSVRDASWWVGSGQSLATHVAQLLSTASVDISELTRLALIDQGGSYTSARTAYAFAQALGFARQLPIVLRRSPIDRGLADEIRATADQLPSAVPLVPRYAAQ